MPTTGHGLVYPDSTGNVNLWEHFQNLADSTEAALDAYEAFTSWTPVMGTGFTSVGTGGYAEGFYQQIGKLVHAEFRFELGTSPTMGSGVFTINLPVAAYVWSGAVYQGSLGSWNARDNSGGTHYAGTIAVSGGGTAAAFTGAWSGTSSSVRVTNALPFAWAVDDVFSGVLNYRAA